MKGVMKVTEVNVVYLFICLNDRFVTLWNPRELVF